MVPAVDSIRTSRPVSQLDSAQQQTFCECKMSAELDSTDKTLHVFVEVVVDRI